MNHIIDIAHCKNFKDLMAESDRYCAKHKLGIPLKEIPAADLKTMELVFE